MNPFTTQRGFSLIEIMVAMGILVIGMSGILSLFASALQLQKEAAERIDIGLGLSAIQAEIERDLTARLAGEKKTSPRLLSGSEFPVPGDPVYRYRVTLQPLPDDAGGRGWLCRVVVVAKRKGQESLYDLGYLPVMPRPDNDALLRSIDESGRSSRPAQR